MMDEAGRVALGSVDRALTVVDPAAPGGRRMDPAAVLAAFDAAWAPTEGDGAAAVLVEMSDLERAERNGMPLAGPEREAALAQPLREADALLGQLLERVDLERDRVIVVSPAAPGDIGRLTVFGLAGRGIEPGKAKQRDHSAGRLRDAARRGGDGARRPGPEGAREHERHRHHVRRRPALHRRGGAPPGRRRRDRPLPRSHRRPRQRRLHRAAGADLRAGRVGAGQAASAPARRGRCGGARHPRHPAGRLPVRPRTLRPPWPGAVRRSWSSRLRSSSPSGPARRGASTPSCRRSCS